MRHEVQGYRREIISVEQCSDVSLFCQADDLPLGAHEAAHSGIGQHMRLVRLGGRAGAPRLQTEAPGAATRPIPASRG